MNETRLKTLEEKADLTLELLRMVYDKLEPNAAYSLRQFSDGSGGFYPSDTTPNPPQQ